jgi:hypothetical protein
MMKNNKTISIDKQDNKTIISVYPKFYKDEQVNNVTPTIIILESDKIKVTMNIDINISNNEYDEILGIDTKKDENFLTKGTWISKKQFVTNISSVVNRIELEEEDVDLEYVVQITTYGNIINIRTKNEEIQDQLLTLLEEWYNE